MQVQTTYVIGDIHGRFKTLEALFGQLDFNIERDRLWLVGDLVNRGPRSLEVLRWANGWSQRLGDRFQMVLGNHDLHLVALHLGLSKRTEPDLVPILESPEAPELVAWLLQQPLLYSERQFLLVHAGLLPSWDQSVALHWADKVSQTLQDFGQRPKLLARRPPEDEQSLNLWRALEAFTRLRTCTLEGQPCGFKGPPEQAPEGCLPWFRIPQRRSKPATVIFGHWAALGLIQERGVFALDSGCAWGGKLTALRLETGGIIQQDPCDEK